MPIFGLQDIDPLFDSMSQANQETILSLAHGQAGSFVPALQSVADEATAPLRASGQTRKVPHDTELLEEDDFNWVMSEAHPTVLKSLFVMGFCQGFCLRHRLMALDTDLYAFFGDDDDETEDKSDEELLENVGAEGTE